MTSTLTTIDCPAGQENLLDSLVRLYGRLRDIVEGRRLFGGFVVPDDLDAKYHMKLENYPRVTMSFTDEDRRLLSRYAEMDPKDMLACAQTPLERLAIATLWKQGDLGKVRHVATGILERDCESLTSAVATDAPIFKQFGRHLSDPACQPIADQHTLRAYRYQKEGNIRDRRHTLGTVNGKEVEDYVLWVCGLATCERPAERCDRMYEFDKSMFALGKATKAFIVAAIGSTSRERLSKVDQLE
ncbi:Uncharacterised protein [Burkholderia pseudomallei]|nr:Uncharacterised protein [Burkholderia pseudomallei]CAJ8196235.1 Uncharacterised protein [Burkholderia pseudomallei]